MQLLWLLVPLLVNNVPVVISRRSSSASVSTSATGPFLSRAATLDNDHRSQQSEPSFFSSMARHKGRGPNRLRSGHSKETKSRRLYPVKDKKPNIVLIITDDQDVELHSMDYMPKSLRILRDGGTHFTNSFVTTPMCCPSRSSMLTGMYVHNHHVFTNNDNCSSPYWQQTHETKTFATYLSNAGYRTGFFGKYLNEYNGTYIPPGWREWAGLIRNSRFYNYSINVNGRKIKHGDDYHKDYYPDLITNDSISFLKQSKLLFMHKPIMMVLSYPSPHGPEDAAPQYQKMFSNVTTHRTTSWNYAPNADKQWILRQTNKMEDIHIKFTDALHRKRLQTLQSVDDAVEKLYNALLEIGELNNTYIFYTSDHGYHLGQFGLVKGKAMPFDFDIKVPFYVRGPNVPKGVNVSNIVLNLDLAPTILNIAGVDVPDHMDGKSVMKLISEANELSMSRRGDVDRHMLKRSSWRDTFLVESAGRQTADSDKKKGSVKPWKEEPVSPRSYFEHTDGMTKEERINYICQSQDFKSPCSYSQRWECVLDGVRWRLQKCRPGIGRRQYKSNCVCPENSALGSTLPLDLTERRRQRAFLRDHVNKDFKPQFIGSRGRRSSSEDFDLTGVYQLYDVLNLKYDDPDLEVYDDFEDGIGERQEADNRMTTRDTKYHVMPRRCRLTQNNIVNCSDEIYNDLPTWRENKNYVDGQIKLLKVKLTELKDIRKHLKQKRPGDMFVGHRGRSGSSGSFEGLDSDYDSAEETDEGVSQEEHGSETEDGVEEEEEVDDDCICGPRPFGKNSGRRRGSRRHEMKEERRRLKEERMRRRQEKLKRQERKNRRIEKYRNYTCVIEKMNCFVHDNDHWKTPPFWTDGQFCFCQNSNNNTYWCLRTINATHNFLFCEFITGFLSFYDMMKDPYQLYNKINEVPLDVLNQLYYQLKKMKGCSGSKECNVRSRLRGSRLLTSMAATSSAENSRRGRQASSSLLGQERNRGGTNDSDYSGERENLFEAQQNAEERDYGSFENRSSSGYGGDYSADLDGESLSSIEEV